MRDYRNYYSGGTNPWGWMGPPMLPWMSLMRAWSEMLCAFTPGCWPQQPQPMGNTGCGPTPGPQPGVTVWVVASRKAKVFASINPGTECSNLKCDPLQSDPKNQIKVEITPVGGMVCIYVYIPEVYKEGSYSGQIKTSGGIAVGSITVVVE